MTARRGASLIEVLCVMATSSVLLGVGITMISSLMRAERSGSKAVVRRVNISYLSRQFRQDVHASLSAEVFETAEGRQGLRLTATDGGTVEYLAERRGVGRTELSEQAVQHRERFRLFDDSSVRFEVAGKLGDGFVAIEFGWHRRGPNEVVAASGEPTTVLRIESQLNRDHRYENQTK